MRQYNQHPQSSQSDSESIQSDELQQNQEYLLNAEMERIQQQLKTMPYELILKQRKQQQKSQQKAAPAKKLKFGKTKIIEKQKHQKNQAVQVSIHGRNKKKHVDIFEPKRKKAIDPRFESFAGNYNPDLAMKSFNFIPQLQQAQITELKGKLKGRSKRHKLTPHQREVLTNQYNKVTSEYKRAELIQLQKQTKKELKQNHGQDFHIKKNVFRQEFQKKKLANMSEADRQKKLKEKDIQMRRNHLNQRRKTLHMNPKNNNFKRND